MTSADLSTAPATGAPMSPPLEIRDAHAEGTNRRFAQRLVHEILRALGVRYGLSVVAIILFGLASLLPAQLYRFFTQGLETLEASTARDFLLDLALVGGGTALALFLASLGTAVLQERFRLTLEAELRRKVIRRIHETPVPVIQGAQRGEWLTRMTGDLMAVESFLTHSVPDQIQDAAVLVGAGVLFFLHSGPLGLIPLITAITIARVNLGLQRRLAPILGEVRTLHGRVFQLLIESLEGIRAIRAASAERQVEQRFESRLVEINSKSMHMVRLLGALLGGNELAGQLLVTGCLSAVAWGLAHDDLSRSDALVYPFFLGLFYGAAQRLASAAYGWNRFLVEGERLGQLLYADTPEVMAPTSAPEGIEAATRVRLVDLTVGHSNPKKMGPLSLELNRGEVVAVMGPSGCGKTTLLEVLAGLQPHVEGRIIFEAERGVLWDSAPGRARMVPVGPCALVEQHPYIFEGTLRENLTLGQKSRVEDARITAELRRVALQDFARDRGGLDHMLRDRGSNLSEGERYRIALCRALLQDRPILLIDEPFAALDELSVRVVVETLNEVRCEKAILVVTHQVPEQLRLGGVLRI